MPVEIHDDVAPLEQRVAPQGAPAQRHLPVVRDSVWADDDNLMILAYEPAGWSIYRLGVDGSKERVVGPNPAGDEATPAYVLLGS